jgi:hypothetical protein
MNSSNQTVRHQETSLENFTADLTEAAYRAALRHGIAGSWVDLELDLWQVLADRVQKWKRDLPRCG